MLKKDTDYYLIHSGDEHNKFYVIRYDAAGNTKCRYGRLGTAGKPEDKSHGHEYTACRFAEKKYDEKIRKGYFKVSKADFDKKALEAAIVGSQNKCTEFRWIEDTPKGVIYIGEDRIAHPDCKVGIYVEFTTRKVYDGLTEFVVIVWPDTSVGLYYGPHVIRRGGSSRKDIEDNRLSKGHPANEMVEKVCQAIGSNL